MFLRERRDVGSRELYALDLQLPHFLHFQLMRRICEIQHSAGLDCTCALLIRSHAGFFGSTKNARPEIIQPSSTVQIPLVDRNASFKQVAAVGIAFGHGDGKSSRSSEDVDGSYYRECDW